LPQAIADNILIADGYIRTDSPQSADYHLEIGAGQPASWWVYVLAAAFPTLEDGFAYTDLQQAWMGKARPPFDASPILLSEDTYQVFASWWGEAAPEAVRILPETELVQAAWDNRPSLALLPFEKLEPRWKVLQVDGQSPYQPGFDPLAYPLTVPIGIVSQDGSPPIQAAGILTLPATNFEPAKLTRLVLTGVTAMVRGTALTMEARGVNYPAETILPWLTEADILHISNEIPFYSNCPPPVLYPDEIKFCSPPGYVELLETIGTDLIELDGDHFGDYGPEAMLETLAIYEQRGWPYYGGGENANRARQPVYMEHNGNRLAFLGCNAKGIGYYATASDLAPGAVMCDFPWMEREIARLSQAGYLVVVTFQHNEYYTYEAQPDLVRDFERVAQAGAVIVSGSQAHQPHGMAFVGNSFLHYGLGNLFFDQYRFFPGPELDRAFLDRHIFYNGRYIGSDLLTIKFVDLARSRPATEEERKKFLEEIFTASGW
jgi:poly-gamma-glutamate synthesis protein (capsule biosynthesis protein)